MDEGDTIACVLGLQVNDRPTAAPCPSTFPRFPRARRTPQTLRVQRLHSVALRAHVSTPPPLGPGPRACVLGTPGEGERKPVKGRWEGRWKEQWRGQEQWEGSEKGSEKGSGKSKWERQWKEQV